MPIHGFPGGVISSTAVTPSPTSASGVWTLDEQLQAGANWPVAPALLSNSVRLRASANAYLTRTPATSTNRKTFTFSAWVKRGKLSTAGESPHLIRVNANVETAFRFEETNALRFFANPATPSINLVTTQVFRDPSSWYHLVLAVDTTQATSSNRVKIYVNGSQITAFDTAVYPAQNYETGFNQAVAHGIGATPSGGENYDGYLTDVNFIDGQALTPNYFGAVDAATGVWEPATYRGTYGTNGFYLPMNVQVEDYSVEYLVVAGGGGGAAGSAGGGGAGGLLTSTTSVIPSSAYTVTIGAGGAQTSGTESQRGNSGSNSVFGSVTAIGGGGGGANDVSGQQNGLSGGSGGGGGSAGASIGTGGAATSGQGNTGGIGATDNATYRVAGGGGGAGAVGGNSLTGTGDNKGGAGGAGLASSISGSSVTYAGGGGGATGGVGGSGGGGTAGNGGGSGTAGTVNRGGGGGAGGYPVAGSAGGSGVVILRYLGAQRGTGGTVTSAGGYTIHTFTSSGSYTA